MLIDKDLVDEEVMEMPKNKKEKTSAAVTLAELKTHLKSAFQSRIYFKDLLSLVADSGPGTEGVTEKLAVAMKRAVQEDEDLVMLLAQSVWNGMQGLPAFPGDEKTEGTISDLQTATLTTMKDVKALLKWKETVEKRFSWSSSQKTGVGKNRPVDEEESACIHCSNPFSCVCSVKKSKI